MALSGSYSYYFYQVERILVEWEASQDYVNNTSTITQRIYFDPGDSLKRTVVSGDRLFFQSYINGNDNVGEFFVYNGTYQGVYKLGEHTKTLDHNSDGTLNNVSLSVYMASGGDGYISEIGSLTNQHITNATPQTTVNLNKIDRTYPSFTSIQASNILATSFDMSITVDSICDKVYYSFDSGSTFSYEFDVNGSTFTNTITGLSPNTTYPIVIEVRKASNHLKTSTYYGSITTANVTSLQSVSNYIFDVSTDLTINIDNPYTFTFRLYARYNNTDVFYKSPTLTAGDNTISLTPENITALKNLFSSSDTSKTITWRLYSYLNGTSQGYSETTATVSYNSSDSAPIIGTVTYADISSVASVTGDNQVFVTGKSELTVTFTGSQAKNGATIESYSVQIGSTVVSDSSNVVHFGTLSGTYGTVSMHVTVTDSRNFVSSQDINLTVLNYNDIYFSSAEAERDDGGIGQNVDYVLSGVISPITVSGVNKNSVQHLYFKYKQTDAALWTDGGDLISDVTQTNTSFSAANTLLPTFSSSLSYYIQFTVHDKISSYIVEITLTQGVPLIAFRKGLIDIHGNIKRNGNFIAATYSTSEGGDNVLDNITSDISNNIPVLVINQSGKVFFYSDQSGGNYYFTSFDHSGNISYVYIDSTGTWH